MENNFKDRVDKTILRAVYTEDKKSLRKILASDKYQIKFSELSPFVDTSLDSHKVKIVKEQYRKQMRKHAKVDEEFR